MVVYVGPSGFLFWIPWSFSSNVAPEERSVPLIADGDAAFVVVDMGRDGSVVGRLEEAAATASRSITRSGFRIWASATSPQH